MHQQAGIELLWSEPSWQRGFSLNARGPRKVSPVVEESKPASPKLKEWSWIMQLPRSPRAPRRPLQETEAPEPPVADAPMTFACFLSHYREEARSDARLMQTVLERRTGQLVYLDATDADDLSTILTEGVGRSAGLVLLQTQHVLTRPWQLGWVYTRVPLHSVRPACTAARGLSPRLAEVRSKGLRVERGHT